MKWFADDNFRLYFTQDNVHRDKLRFKEEYGLQKASKWFKLKDFHPVENDKAFKAG